MCLVGARAQKKFFLEAKCIYLKIFSIIISLDGIVSIVQWLKNVSLIMAKIGYFEPFLPTPPDSTKSQKKFSFPLALKIFNIKTF